MIQDLELGPTFEGFSSQMTHQDVCTCSLLTAVYYGVQAFRIKGPLYLQMLRGEASFSQVTISPSAY